MIGTLIQAGFAMVMAVIGWQILSGLELKSMWEHGQRSLLSRPVTWVGVLIVGGFVGGLVLVGLLGKLFASSAGAASLEDMPPAQLAIALGANFMMQGGWVIICCVIPAVFKWGPSLVYGMREVRFGHAFVMAVALVLIALPFVLIATALNLGLVSLLERTIGYEAGMQDAVMMAVNAESPMLMFLMFLTAVIGAPVSEEFTFRGVLLPWFCRSFGMWTGLLVVGVFFGIMHLHIPSILPLTVLGIFFGVGYILGRSIWVPIFMHLVFNGANIAILFTFPGMAG